MSASTSRIEYLKVRVPSLIGRSRPRRSIPRSVWLVLQVRPRRLMTSRVVRRAAGVVFVCSIVFFSFIERN